MMGKCVYYVCPFLILLFALGCLTPVKVNPLQKLYLDPHIRVNKGVCSGYSIALREVEYSRAIANYVAYITDDGVLHYDETQQWAEHPTEVVFRVVCKTLKETGRFRDIDDVVKIKNPDFIGFVDLRKFFIRDFSDKTEFVFSVHFKIRNARTGEVVAEKEFEVVKPYTCSENITAVVNQTLGEFAIQLAEFVNNAPLCGSVEKS
ncbi:MAG: ABC-type transport auxiliary lipoprotein family protein [Candidatus Hydrogenedentes bacterium]|nr:ABC-type transport auxiliary lipoprotein family protein [Candidatus Hydrogenedentota bacterium]